MATYQQIRHSSRPAFDSPAKIFAKLKSKVRRESSDDVFDNEFPGERRTPRRKIMEENIQHDIFSNGEVTAITLSPISSPQKITRCRPEDDSDEPVLRRAPRLKPFMESTTVSSTSPTTLQSHMEEPQAGWFADRPVRRELGGSVFSPMKTRLKRKLNEQSKADNMGSDADYFHRQEKGKKNTRAFSEDDHNTNVRVVDPVPPKYPGRVLDTAPAHPATPAKIFAYLKEKENRKDQFEVQKVTSSTRPEWDEPGELRLQHNRTDSDVDNQSEVMEEPVCEVSRANEPQSPEIVEEAGSGEAVSTVPQPPVVLQDPLLLSSPCVCIPKLQGITQAVFKRNQWPRGTTFPSEKVIHLKKWFIRNSPHGLFLDGIHSENNSPWNSNIIAERVSKTALKTVTGRIYVLVGKMDLSAPSQFPKRFLKNFTYGFPTTWKEIYDKYLSDSKGVKRRPQGKCESKSQKSRTPMDQSLQQQKPVKSTESCPSSTTPGIQMSRSGRLIKPPLEYWRGGRIILDAHMNVTIHDGYDSVLNPDITGSFTTKSPDFKMPAKKVAKAKTLLTDDCVQHESISQSLLQRKIKEPQRRPRNTKSSVIEKPSGPLNPVPTSRVLRTRQEAEPRDIKRKTNPELTVTKAKPVNVSQQSASSQCSSPVDTRCSPRSSNRRQGNKNISKKAEAKQRENNSPVKHGRSSSRSSHSSQENETRLHKSQKTWAKNSKKTRSKTPSPKPAEVAPKTAAQAKRTRRRAAHNKGTSQLDDDAWSEDELRKLQEAVSCHPTHVIGYWTKVAMMVGTRSAEECFDQYSCQGASKTPAKREKKVKQKVPLKEKVDNALITARVGTLKRKQQVRDFLDAMPKEDMDDVFSSAYMRSKRFEVPSICPSDDHEFSMSEPLTPKPSGFPEAKTPQCLHITPNMMGSSSRNCDDKYVFQLQKRMKNHYQFNVQKHAPKSFSPTASVKKTMRRCENAENNSFVVWEMFPDKEAEIDSEEEEDFYFTGND